MPTAVASLRDEKLCYLTTVGRASGLLREVEMWFDVHEDTVYMLSGNRERSDWVRNLMHRSRVTVRIGSYEFAGRARVVDARSDEDALARRLLVRKYRTRDDDLSGWGRSALAIAIRIDG